LKSLPVYDLQEGYMQPHKKINFKNPLKETKILQDIISLTNLKFQIEAKISSFKNFSYKNRPIIINEGPKSLKLLDPRMNLNTISLPDPKNGTHLCKIVNTSPTYGQTLGRTLGGLNLTPEKMIGVFNMCGNAEQEGYSQGKCPPNKAQLFQEDPTLRVLSNIEHH
jgi:hypothetical protein